MSTGHGNHWECHQKPVEKAIGHFIPAAVARGKMRESIKREGLWFDRTQPSEEAVLSIVMGGNSLGVMALVVTDTPRKRSVLYSAFPYAAKGVKQHYALTDFALRPPDLRGFRTGTDYASTRRFVPRHFHTTTQIPSHVIFPYR
jgi:hypothetical protein